MKNILIIGFLLVALSSCDSFLKEYSQDLAKVETITDLDELLLGSAYLPNGYYYISNYTAYRSGGEDFNIFTHFMSDELEKNTWVQGNVFMSGISLFGYYTWQRQVGIDEQEQSVGAENQFWNSCYKYINVTNMIIDELKNINTSNSTEESDKTRVEGETHFLRALYYFTLVNLYAPPYSPATADKTLAIPLKLTSYVEDKNYQRATLTTVYKQILEDLDKAEECLKQTEHKSLYRADLTATYLLKSRLYLYMQDYPNTRIYAQNVLDCNNALENLNSFTGADNIFTAQSSEVIFSMGGHFLSMYMYGNDREAEEYPYYISEDLVNVFKEQDLRKSLYIKENEYGYTFKKIYWGRAHLGTACSVSDNFLFRTSEAYLNLAEAAALDDNKDEAKARELITHLQSHRFRQAPTITESGNALVSLIREERQRELCLEGHRWPDLRRYTVCEKFPWSKSFRHTWSEFRFNYDSYEYELLRSRTYELEENDNAYTLAFPKEVIEFQNTITTNERPERRPVIDINKKQN